MRTAEDSVGAARAQRYSNVGLPRITAMSDRRPTITNCVTRTVIGSRGPFLGPAVRPVHSAYSTCAGPNASPRFSRPLLTVVMEYAGRSWICDAGDGAQVCPNGVQIVVLHVRKRRPWHHLQ